MTSNTKILLVDDEPRNLKILRIRLEETYELKEVTSGEDALAVIHEFDPALVLLDIMMEGIDGYEVTRRIKADPALKKVKIILISGKAMIDEKLMGYECGADDYITKPFNGEELRAKIAVFMKLYNLEAELTAINESLEDEVRRRCDQLLQAERLASVGMHSAEIVHNLKNPLSIVKGNISIIQGHGDPDGKRLEKIDAAADRILNIVKGILSTTPTDIKSEFQEVDLEKAVAEELEFLNIQNEFRHITKSVDLAATRHIWATPVQVAQILGNLIKNAAEAMMRPEGHTYADDSTAKACELKISSKDDNGFVLVEVSDSGSGIPNDKLPQVFNPLFTTKDGKEGRPVGNGLGLPYCKSTVESMGGKISVESEEGVGTTFKVQFPTNKTNNRVNAQSQSKSQTKNDMT